MQLIDITPSRDHASTLVARLAWYLPTDEEISIAIDAAIDAINTEELF